MIAWLSLLVQQFVCWVETAIAFVFNGVVAGLGLVLTGALALLPSMPTLPSVPPDIQNSFALGNYLLPITFSLGLLSTVATIEITIWVIKVALRWGKAVS